METRIEEILKRVRTSTEIGVGSCSSVDECQTDDEVRADIREYLEANPNITNEEVFQEIVDMDKTIMSVMMERYNMGGEEW